MSLGPEGWILATAPEVSPEDVHFRWSPKHQDLEVISKNSRPVYLHAPGRNKSRSLPDVFMLAFTSVPSSPSLYPLQ